MKTAPTLADAVIRGTFAKRHQIPVQFRQRIASARRFVLDASMSEFLADLSTAPFICSEERRADVLDSLRHSARLPHASTWIEYDGLANRNRMMAEYPQAVSITGGRLAEPDAVCPRFGWLLENHPTVTTAVRMTEFAEFGDGLVAVVPFSSVWQTTDDPLPWGGAEIKDGMFAHGISGYVCPQIGVLHDGPIPDRHTVQVQTVVGDWTSSALLVEFAGCARYAMALLAALNDIPVLSQEIKQHRGYVARGQYRKFVDHTILHLTVPAHRSMRSLAARVIAAARRRAHQVRGHWRLYQRGDGVLCGPAFHDWQAADDTTHLKCSKCTAWKTWIPEHERGDASLGFVTHDYAVTHPC